MDGEKTCSTPQSSKAVSSAGGQPVLVLGRKTSTWGIRDAMAGINAATSWDGEAMSGPRIRANQGLGVSFSIRTPPSWKRSVVDVNAALPGRQA
jgi:hypothetical protein